MRLDSVQIGAADPADAARAYALVLGVAPVAGDGAAARFQLRRGAVEIVPGEPGLRAVTFVAEADDTAPWPAEPAAFHGLPVRIGAAAAAAPEATAPGTADGIDHVVVQTPDADRAIALWRDRLGLRLAFDRAFPERGLRLVFFRSGGVTLEFATPHPALPPGGEPDRLYGVSYRVVDLAAVRARLAGAGVDVSEVRPGHKVGTRVATVRSGTAGIPTLLLEEPARAP
jgi:catechol 2,3-dioxygenase-like lactoylglutathione lyase family enzyme